MKSCIEKLLPIISVIILALGLFFLGMYVSALAVQYPAYLKVHLAIDPKFVGNVGSVFALFSHTFEVFYP